MHGKPRDSVIVASEKADFIADRIASGTAAPELEMRKLARYLREIAAERVGPLRVRPHRPHIVDQSRDRAGRPDGRVCKIGLGVGGGMRLDRSPRRRGLLVYRLGIDAALAAIQMATALRQLEQ